MMDGRHIGILLPVSILTYNAYVNPHVILHLPVKFRSNRTNIGGVLTSYRFFNMAAIESESYFQVQFY